MIMISSGVSPSTVDLLWTWLQQFPANNFDDGGPQSAEALHGEITDRLARGEWLWTVEHEAMPVGVIGVAPVSHRTAMFHGICFDRAVHGRGLAGSAVLAVLDSLWARGIDKVSAAYFADNAVIRRFLSKLGASDEGLLRQQTVRSGVPVDMRLVAFFRS